MKNQIALTAFLLIVAAALAPAQSNDARCNDGLIRGEYAFTVEGQRLAAPGSFIPQAGVAMTTFDGRGNLMQIDTVVFGGTLASDFTHAPATGTYTVNSNCTGTFTLNFQDGRPPVTVNFVVSNNGNEIDTVVISPPVLATRSIGKRRFSGKSGDD